MAARRGDRRPAPPLHQGVAGGDPRAGPDLTRTKEELRLRSADLPSLLRLPPGCTFHPRCPLFEEGLCDVVRPTLVPIAEGRFSACHVVARERTGHIATLDTAQAAD